MRLCSYSGSERVSPVCSNVIRSRPYRLEYNQSRWYTYSAVDGNAVAEFLNS